MPPRVAPIIVQQPNTDSIYYVHPSEGPNSVTVTPLLTGSNYLTWSRSMKHTLGTKNKFAFIDGSVPIPPMDDLNRNAWERCNNLIHSWIINSVSPQIAQTIVFHEHAIDVWIELQERFSKVDRIRVASLRSSINNLKQGDKSVLDYFTEMKSLWEELNSHRPMPMCTCPYPCRCESMRAAHNFRKEDQVIQFLTGLNDSFSVVKTQVLLMDPLPSINKVYSMVVQEESNNAAPTPHISTEDSSILVNVSDARKPFMRGKASGAPQSKNNSRYCTCCHRNNHTVEYSYQKHGYPNANKSVASSNAVNSEHAMDSNTSSEGISSVSQTGLTQEQYVHLVSLLQQSSLVPSATTSNPASTNHIATSFPSSIDFTSGINTIFSCSLHVPSDHWLIDSGANEHICSSLHLFHSYYKIKPINVNLPNGSSVLVQYAGTVVFSPHFHITHVLYSPVFKVNLISVSKICQSLPYHVHFLLNTCVIQDVKTQKMIGLGNLCDGLYRLHPSTPAPPQAHFISSVVSSSNKVSLQSCNSVSSGNHVSSIPSNAIWHFRLGHLSNQRLSMMHSLYPSITIDNKAICDICHFAKQRKLPYNLSTSVASSKFELLHFDIWGPLSITVVHGHKYFLTIVDDFSRFLWVILLKNKSEVSSHVKNCHFDSYSLSNHS